jgi:hypothetical protein
MNDVFWSRLFLFAAVYNFAAGFGPLVLPQTAAEAFGIAPLGSAMPMQMLGLLVIVFGIGYLFVARDLDRMREIVILGVIGKTGVFLIIGAHFLAGGASLTGLAVAVGDLLFVFAFIRFLQLYPGRG